MEYVIRNVKIEDLDAVVQVESECFPDLEAAGREALKRRIETFPDSFFVAESLHEAEQTEKTIIGFINGCVTDDRVICDAMFSDSVPHNPEGAYQSVFGLDVRPLYRRQGIAKELMLHLTEDARRRGRKGLILTCKESLIHYYEKFGYVNSGISASVHGGAVWYDMVLEF